jgi:hypothetical protein
LIRSLHNIVGLVYGGSIVKNPRAGGEGRGFDLGPIGDILEDHHSERKDEGPRNAASSG